MKCKGVFVFKSLSYRPAGTFKNDNEFDDFMMSNKIFEL